jgi:hypothetical protein
MVLLVSLLFLALAPASAQVSVQAIPICLTSSNQAVTNLVACGMKFNALGEVQFTVRNLGTVGINMPTGIGGRTPSRTSEPTTPPVQMDIYMGGQKIASTHLQSIGANDSRTITVAIPSNYTKPRCAESRALRLVVDATSLVAESSEADNAYATTSDRPCPDMAIEYINKDWNSLKTEFVAKIKIVNLGNAPARFRYMALTSNSSSFGPLPSADFDKWMEIEEGGSKTFTIGNAFATSSMYVRVFLDRWYEVDELNESNNFKEETLNN